MSDREQLEVEAAELYPEPERDLEEAVRSNLESYGEGARAAHVRAKTVTAEQVEAAARVMHEMTVDTLWGESESERAADREVQRAAFRAAGFLIEGDGDE